MRLIFFSAFFLITSTLAFAQANINAPSSIQFIGREATDFSSGPDYKNMVYDALDMDQGLDFGYFRMLYSNMQNYTPIADDLQREMLSLAYTIKSQPVSDERAKAMERYTEILLQNLANIDVVVMALSLSEENPKLGKPDLFKWIYKGLLESVLRSGNGATLAKAFKVVTLGEESALLARMGYKVLETTPGHENNVYYNMHKVQDPKTGQTYTVFVETSIPMKFLEEQNTTGKASTLLPSVPNAKIR